MLMARKKKYMWHVIFRRRGRLWRALRKRYYVEADDKQEAWEKIERELANFGGNKRQVKWDIFRGSYVVWLWLGKKHIQARTYRMRVIRRGGRVVKGMWK